MILALNLIFLQKIGVKMQKDYPEVSAFDFETQALALKTIEHAWKSGNANYLLKVMKEAALYRSGHSDVG